MSTHTALSLQLPLHLLPVFFFTDPATTDISTLSLHDALPIWLRAQGDRRRQAVGSQGAGAPHGPRQEHSGAEAGGGETVPDAGGGRVLDHGARHGGHGADRPGQEQGRGGSGGGGLGDGQEGGGHGGRDVRQAARRGAGGGQRRPAAARGGEDGCRARHGARQAGQHHAAHDVRGRGVRPHEGRGRPPHAVLQGVPAAVLSPDDRRDGDGGAAGGRGDGDAGRQHENDDRADHADRDGGAVAVRDS